MRPHDTATPAAGTATEDAKGPRSDMTSYDNYPGKRPSGLPMILTGAIAVMVVWLLVQQVEWSSDDPDTTPRTVTPRGDLAPLEQSFIEIFQRSSPSVAHINTASIVRTRWGSQEQQGSGSGFVWDEAGTVVTNYHVVAGASQVEVSVGGRNYQATVRGKSPDHDLAILQLQGSTAGLSPLPLGTSTDLQVGQTAIAIGNPFGFDQTMTSGIVSALNRTVPTRDNLVMHGLIQVDAAINPGNSGGPLLDSHGRLIGVTTAIYSPSGASAGIGFAVPVDTVRAIVPRLLQNRPTQVVLGVRGNYDIRLDPETGFQSGAIITEVLPGYGAEAAGIKPFRLKRNGRRNEVEQYGDVIVAVDGQPVRSFNELPRLLVSHKPGDQVRITVLRGLPETPKREELTVTLSAKGEGITSDL